MIIYIAFELLAGIVGGILIAALTKKADGVKYGVLDKVGFVTNILLIPAYVFISPFCMVIGLISEPYTENIITILFGSLVAFIIASMPLFASLGLGFSVALRKKGKSKLSFTVQFAGIVAALLTFGLYELFAGVLVSSLN